MNTQLPQLDGRVFLSEGGLETDLIFHHDIDLPDFASFPLLESTAGRATLHDYFQSVVDLARRDGTGVVLETPTWRANPDWGRRLGYDDQGLDAVNRGAVGFLAGLRDENLDVPFVISGNLGPRGDGYTVDDAMTAERAADYHAAQISSFATAGADLVTALTMNYSAEAVGIVRAAANIGVPVVISFTVETDGVLPSGQALGDAIDEVDALTNRGAAYFMVNCAHPTHVAHVLAAPGPWDRVRGIRANASRMSHEELDNATELDRGNEVELAEGYAELARLLPNLAVAGGCCGTDIAHLDAISRAVA
jgi:S-methylmethionine-dependent homocysteine/selenocysteine methylase